MYERYPYSQIRPENTDNRYSYDTGTQLQKKGGFYVVHFHPDAPKPFHGAVVLHTGRFIIRHNEGPKAVAYDLVRTKDGAMACVRPDQMHRPGGVMQLLAKINF